LFICWFIFGKLGIKVGIIMLLCGRTGAWMLLFYTSEEVSFCYVGSIFLINGAHALTFVFKLD